MKKKFVAFVLLAAASGLAAQTSTDDSADINLLINARLQIRDGKIDQADETTREFLTKHPESGQAHFLLGFILFKEAQQHAAVDSTQEKARLSLAEYTEGAKYQKPSSLDLKIVALDYVLLGDMADADTWLTRSLSWNPKDAEAWYDLGRIKESEKNFPEAEQAFEQSVKLDPLNTKAEEARKRAAEEH